MLRLHFALLISLTFSISLCAQIVNIESLRTSVDSNGFFGVENFNISFTKNTQDLLDITNNLSTQFKRDKHVFLFLNTLDISLADKVSLERNSFFHLRYNYHLNKLLIYEVFSQYQRDVPLRIAHRGLIGLGPRLRLVESAKSKMFFGALAMYEYDEELNNEIIHRNYRLSAYLSTALHFEERLNWNIILYYQPRFDYWKDFRTSLQTQLTIALFGKVDYVTTFDLSYDAFPVKDPDIPKFTLKWVNGLSLRF